MKQTRTTLFSVSWAELIDVVVNQGLPVTVECATPKQASSLRLRFYGYRSSLRRDPERRAEADRADSVIASLAPEDHVLYFQNRDMTAESKLLAHSIQNALNGGPKR